MDSKYQGFKVPSHSMRSNDGYSVRPQSSAPKKNPSLTLFEDLLDYPNTENLHSGTNLADQRQKAISFPDCGRGVSATDNGQKSWLSKGFIRVTTESDRMYESIRKKLVSSLSPCGIEAQVETIYKNSYSSLMSQAKVQSFVVYSEAIQKKRDGDANMKYAWYGASKDVINGIVSYGFGLPLNNGVYGHGLHLSAFDHPIECLQSSTADEDGLRHMLICRVILGSVEVISPLSGQYNPSSEAFDSGVDSLVCPKKYIIWNANMNTHILPEFVISFRTSSYFSGCLRITPTSDWISMAGLVNDLSHFLSADDIKLVAKQYNDYKKQKLRKNEMVQRVRGIVGDRLLIAMIKLQRERRKYPGAAQLMQPM